MNATQSTGGIGMEKFMFRGLLLAMVGAALAALFGSTDDIKRYVRIRAM